MSMRCSKCGHALGNISAVCPNCGTMMNNAQLQERKEMNGGANAYIQRINEVKSKKLWNNSSSYSQPNSKNQTGLVALVLLLGLLAIVAILFLV